MKALFLVMVLFLGCVVALVKIGQVCAACIVNGAMIVKHNSYTIYLWYGTLSLNVQGISRGWQSSEKLLQDGSKWCVCLNSAHSPDISFINARTHIHIYICNHHFKPLASVLCVMLPAPFFLLPPDRGSSAVADWVFRQQALGRGRKDWHTNGSSPTAASNLKPLLRSASSSSSGHGWFGFWRVSPLHDVAHRTGAVKEVYLPGAYLLRCGEGWG